MHTASQVWTCSGRRLGIDPGDLLVSEPDPARPVILVQMSGRPTLGFMLSQEGPSSIVSVLGVTYRTAIQPWRVRLTEAGTFLQDPSFGFMLMEQPEGAIAVQPRGEEPTAAMRLAALPDDALSPGVRQAIRMIDRLLPVDLNGPEMLDRVAGVPRSEAEALQALIRLLPKDQVDWLGINLIGRPLDLASLAAAFPDDIWATTAMPALRQWLLTRKGSRTASIAGESDFLADAGLNGQPTSAPHMLSVASRAGVASRKPFCVVTTARNEGLYLLEWVAYHREIGADAIFVYSNDNTDNSDGLLHALADAGEITWINNRIAPGFGPQPKAYGHAFGVFPDILDHRWTLVIDLDEFVGYDTKRFSSFPDYIAWHETQRVDMVALNWLVFGSGGAPAWTDVPMVKRFTKLLPWTDRHIKSLGRTNLCMHSHPHHPVFRPGCEPVRRGSDGAPYRYTDDLSFAAEPRFDAAWVSHYFLKSTEEFIWKFARSRSVDSVVQDLTTTQIDDRFATMFIQHHESTSMIDHDRTALCAPGLRDAMERLRQSPAVASAERQVRAVYDGQITRLVEQLRRSTAAGPSSPAAQLATLCR
jgi:hypothetical protein